MVSPAPPVLCPPAQLSDKPDPKAPLRSYRFPTSFINSPRGLSFSTCTLTLFFPSSPSTGICVIYLLRAHGAGGDSLCHLVPVSTEQAAYAYLLTRLENQTSQRGQGSRPMQSRPGTCGGGRGPLSGYLQSSAVRRDWHRSVSWVWELWPWENATPALVGLLDPDDPFHQHRTVRSPGATAMAGARLLCL